MASTLAFRTPFAISAASQLYRPAAAVAASSPLQPGRVSFSSTPAAAVTARQHVEARYGKLPPYPYPYQNWYKKANFGLFGGARVRFGNNISEETETRSRRRWYPNVHRKRLWSRSLGRWVRVRVVARVLRSIDRAGGLDEYLLGEKAARIRDLGHAGWALRWRIMRTDAVRERFRLQRELLGLTATAPVTPLAPGSSPQPAVLGVDVVQEEDVGVPDEELRQREAAIDRVLDQDAENEAKGIDGGIELGGSMESERGEQPAKGRRRW